MKIYTVVKVEGFGVPESPINRTPTAFSFTKIEDARKKAEELWHQETTEEERKSGWCYIHYSVDITEVQ